MVVYVKFAKAASKNEKAEHRNRMHHRHSSEGLEFFSPLASKRGSLAILVAMRRASSWVSTFAMWASFG